MVLQYTQYNTAICKPRHWNLGIGNPPTKSRDTLYHGDVTIKRRYVSTFPRPMDAKLSRLVT